MPASAQELRIPAKGVLSLTWDGDRLIDWVAGGTGYSMDGQIAPAAVRYAYPFDAAIATPNHEYVVIYTRLGTKGLVLHKGRIIREINRSFYHADVYEYPVAITQTGSGETILAHCPREYNLLEFEDLQTGRPLSSVGERQPSDFFHSRLRFSPDSQFLVSAGWLWHPVDEVRLFDVQRGMKDASHLDGDGLILDAIADESSATFLADGRLAVGLNRLMRDAESYGDAGADRGELRIYSLPDVKLPNVIPYERSLGSLAAATADQILCLHGHPRLLDLSTGKTTWEWPSLDCGQQTSSILMQTRLPVMAIDPTGRRFAVADADGISVIEFKK